MNRMFSPDEILDLIAEQVKSLDPPVEKFESSIRTSPFRILISVLLSSRTKDEVTMPASERLFKVADTPGKMSKLPIDKIAELIYPVGFFRQKAKHIARISKILKDETARFPSTFEALMKLPGIGRKSANLVLAISFNIPSIAVDIHVFRISKRLGWSRSDKPEGVEDDLKKLFSKQHWNRLNRILVGFGQTRCKPRNPECKNCTVNKSCEYFYSGQSN